MSNNIEKKALIGKESIRLKDEVTHNLGLLSIQFARIAYKLSRIYALCDGYTPVNSYVTTASDELCQTRRILDSLINNIEDTFFYLSDLTEPNNE